MLDGPGIPLRLCAEPARAVHVVPEVVAVPARPALWGPGRPLQFHVAPAPYTPRALTARALLATGPGLSAVKHPLACSSRRTPRETIMTLLSAVPAIMAIAMTASIPIMMISFPLCHRWSPGPAI